MVQYNIHGELTDVIEYEGDRRIRFTIDKNYNININGFIKESFENEDPKSKEVSIHEKYEPIKDHGINKSNIEALVRNKIRDIMQVHFIDHEHMDIIKE